MLNGQLIQRLNWLLIFCAVATIFPGCVKDSRTSGDQTNRLSLASSPYLREHADNPVAWYEWGEEALNKAKAENKPLIISIGYSSCHWCHVMERETFMDTAVARIMNSDFVCIKVDREERPDIDKVYISAAQLMSDNVGWPLNAFATSDGKAFYAVTYSPKDRWTEILARASDAYKSDYDNLLRQAESVMKGVKTTGLDPVPVSDNVDRMESYRDAMIGWESFYDMKSGGIRGAPKFPMPVVWETVLQDYYLTANNKSLAAVKVTLDEMAKGGIFDQVGGGFARYSTDETWKVPHFEKMLYDNAQLVSLYAHGFQQTRDPGYSEVLGRTLDFVQREMTDQKGGFYSSINADSEGEEGKYYVWSKSEFDKVLNQPTADLAADYYHVSDAGNWDNGKNILFHTLSDEDFASTHKMPVDDWKKMLTQARHDLLSARSKRVRPTTDDKILTSWNALMLNGLIDAFFATGNQSYLASALKNADFLERKMMRDSGGVWRNYISQKASVEGFLDDYAFLAKAYIHLYEATFDIHWLQKARELADYALLHFRDNSSGLFFYSSDLSGDAVARTIELTDDVMPSSNSVMAAVLLRLGTYFDETRYQMLGETLLNKISGQKQMSGPYFANWMALKGLMAVGPYEVAVMGENAKAMTREIFGYYLPTSMLMGGIQENLPLLEGKRVKNETIIYVCRDKVCKLPARDVKAALRQMVTRDVQQ
jgi:uncharacterized protein YyaL (SSP411 family)